MAIIIIQYHLWVGWLPILVSPPVPIGLLDLGLLWDLVSGDWTWDLGLTIYSSLSVF